MTQEKIKETCGAIDLGEYRFMWERGRDGEIFGHLQGPNGIAIVQGSSGYWRTTDPDEASKRAKIAFNIKE